MNEDLSNIAREVAEGEAKSDELIAKQAEMLAGQAQMVADLADLRAQIEALINAPNQQELVDSLTARIDAIQTREQAAIDAMTPAPEPEPAPAPDA